MTMKWKEADPIQGEIILRPEYADRFTPWDSPGASAASPAGLINPPDGVTVIVGLAVDRRGVNAGATVNVVRLDYDGEWHFNLDTTLFKQTQYGFVQHPEQRTPADPYHRKPYAGTFEWAQMAASFGLAPSSVSLANYFAARRAHSSASAI